MTQKTTAKHYLEAAMIWLLPTVLRPLPFSLRVKVGGAVLGWLMRVVPPLRRRISENLDLKYPKISKGEKRKFIHRISRHIGRRFIEMFYNGAFHNRTENIHLAEGSIDHILAAKKTGQPIIFISGHFGQWEAPRAYLKKHGVEVGAIYKENSNPIFERRYRREIEKGGKPLVKTGAKGLREMIAHLKSGGNFAILLDQADMKGEMLDFFGMPAYTSVSAAEMALKFNALLIPSYGIIRENGRDIDVVYEAAIEHSDPITMTQQLNDSLAARVKTNPEQWYWLHRRWKMRDPS